MEKSKTKVAAFTICAKNYLSFARTLTDSFLRFHPEAKMFVLLLDKADGYFDPKKEKFEVVEIEELKNVKNLKSFIFKYDIIGLNTAIKPFVAEHLFKKYKIEKLIYFDTDILVFDRLQKVVDLLESRNIVLIPHIVTPLLDESKTPSERTFLLSGSYNLGFIALSNTSETLRFLKWWQEKTYDGAVNKVEVGLFRDQKPVDLVPSLFDGVGVFKDISYNVAYWNLHERNQFEKKGGKYFVNGKPIVFFHYSGYSPDEPEKISKYQNRYKFSDFNAVFRELFNLYSQRLKEASYRESIHWPYTHGYFDNRVSISDYARNLYWEMSGEKRTKFGDPFSTKGKNSLYRFLQVPKYIKFLLRLRDALFPQTTLRRRYYEHYIRPFALLLLGGRRHEDLISFERRKRERKSTSGINLFGYIGSPSGMGEKARSFAKILQVAGVPHEVIDLSSFRKPHHDYPVNLLFVNANDTSALLNSIGAEVWKGKYNIGCWEWELSIFPDVWLDTLNSLSEVWVSSNFVLDSISKSALIPTVKMAWRPEINPASKCRRKDFGLRDEDFVFLFTYDGGHYPERKNLLALVEAFTRAFSGEDKAKLLIKTMNVKPGDFYHTQLKREIKRYKNIILSEGRFERGKILDLFKTSDCYVSLHRSEGFGATIFEAMALGKPVIATGYSGNMDFMNVDNSYPVRYKLVKIKEDVGPYKKGNLWAEPDINHAAKLMDYVFENQEVAREVGRRAKEYVEKNYNWQTLAGNLLDRIKIIQERLRY